MTQRKVFRSQSRALHYIHATKKIVSFAAESHDCRGVRWDCRIFQYRPGDRPAGRGAFAAARRCAGIPAIHHYVDHHPAKPSAVRLETPMPELAVQETVGFTIDP